MVEFRFDIKPLFEQPIVKITPNLLPNTFKGDRRQASDTTAKMSEIIDKLGELSAVSQKLSKSITTAQRLRMSQNQRIYLLADGATGRNGAVIGILKVGTKSLYLYNKTGNTLKVDDTPCILDFYVHETRQRVGAGKDLFDTMLSEEQWLPVKLSIDRPSEKLLSFLKKHYKLEKTIPQANNFVLFDGFFETKENDQLKNYLNGMNITNSPNTALFGAHYFGDDKKKRIGQLDRSPTSPMVQTSPVGRYAAPRPSCSMAEIIHMDTTRSSKESSSAIFQDISEDLRNLKTTTKNPDDDAPDMTVNSDKDASAKIIENAFDETREDTSEDIEEFTAPDNINVKKPASFQLSKQHTGLKNISFNVGMAVTPTNKMEFDQEHTEGFGIIKINRPPGRLPSPPPDNSEALSTVSVGEGLTDQGYYDLKFYHNRLW